MFVKLRENLWLGSEDALTMVDQIKEANINRIVIVANDVAPVSIENVTVFVCGLRSDRMNPTHVKDLACHCPKYMTQNGDKVLIVSKTGLERGAYIAGRLLCEVEAKSIYDVFLEITPLMPGFDIGKAYF